jgi:hypothetical protein
VLNQVKLSRLRVVRLHHYLGAHHRIPLLVHNQTLDANVGLTKRIK